MPDVDFDSEMIIVSSRANVLKVYAEHNQGALRVITGDSKHLDPSLKTTNPSHIIKLEGFEFQSVVFEHNPFTDEETSEAAAFTVAPSCVPSADKTLARRCP